MNKKDTVLRTCVVTHEKLEKKDLIRIVKSPDGKVFIDESLKANGRGCYLKKDKEVILKAKKSKALDRNLNILVNDEIYEELLNRI